jgi:predicted RecA/RadA family phage recombinase
MSTPLVKFVQKGDTVDYTPGSAVAAGDVVVQADLVGVACLDIEANKLGALAVSGVFDFPKDTGSATAIPAGTLCYWDAGNLIASTSSGDGKLIGKSSLAAADDDETVRVRMDQ